MDQAGDLASWGIDMDATYGGAGYSGDPNMGGAVGVPVPVNVGGLMAGDVADQQAMGPWTAPQAAQQGAPWWAGIAAYGVSRAIDNQFPTSPTGIAGNTYPGSGAGYGGNTYGQRPSGAGGGPVRATVRTPMGNASMHSSPTLLILMIGLAYLFLK